MKSKVQHSLFALLLLFLSTGCEMVQEALEQDFDITNTMVVNVKGTGDLQANGTIVEVDFNSGDIATHRDRIKDLTINAISLRVTQFVPGPDATTDPIFNGQMEFAPAGSTTFQHIGTVSNLNLVSEFTNPPATETQLVLNPDTKEELVNMIKAGNKVQFRFTGTSTSNFTSAVLNLKIQSTLTAGI
jgi:hypothetical protein